MADVRIAGSGTIDAVSIEVDIVVINVRMAVGLAIDAISVPLNNIARDLRTGLVAINATDRIVDGGITNPGIGVRPLKFNILPVTGMSASNG